MKIKSDNQLNPALKNQVQTLRQCIVNASESIDIPARFTVVNSKTRPAQIFTDTTTGKKVTVPLYACGEVRHALSELFQ